MVELYLDSPPTSLWRGDWLFKLHLFGCHRGHTESLRKISLCRHVLLYILQEDGISKSCTIFEYNNS
jgi:hypothetical protein